MVASWPATAVGEQSGAGHWWLRPVLVAWIPVAVSVLGGVLLWVALALAELASASLSESLPAVVLSIGTTLGGRFEGHFVNVSSQGFWVLPLAMPLASALVVARLLRRPHWTTYAVGLLATFVAHSMVMTAIGLVDVYDPTSFEVARVAWVPLASFGVAAITWLTAWAAREHDLARSISVALVAASALGAAAGAVVAVREGVGSALVPVSALVGGSLGPNAVGFAAVWAAGAEAGELGGRSPDVESFGALAGDVGAWVWLLPVAAFALLGAAAWRASVIDDLAKFRHRARDAALAATVFVPLVALLAGPRNRGARGASERWIGVADAPGAFVLPILLIVLMLLVTQLVRAVKTGETWPSEVLQAAAGWLRRPARSKQSRPSPPAYPVHGQTGTPWPVAAPLDGHPGAPQAVPPFPTAHPSPYSSTPPAAEPTVNPFAEDAAPPVSEAWAHVPPAPQDPGRPSQSQGVTAPPVGLAEESWRNAPPPSFPAPEAGPPAMEEPS